MQYKTTSFVLVPASIILVFAGMFCSAINPNASQLAATQKREELYRLNNLGVALMEQYKHEDAVKQFKLALGQDANFAIARVNLAMAQYFLNDVKSAVAESQAALKLTPTSLHAQYVLGAAYKNDRLYDEALAAFNKVLAVDPKDPYTNIQIGQIYSSKQQYPQAAEAFRRAMDAEPYNATAVYSLAQALIRAGNQTEGQKLLAQFQKLKASGYSTTLGNTYGEKGKYAEAVVSTGAEAELVSKQGLAVKFVDAAAGLNLKTSGKPLSAALGRKLTKAEFTEDTKRELVAAFSSNIALGDFDGDNKLDALVSGVESGKPFIKLFKNEGGKFADVTDKSKLTTNGLVSGAVFGDFDNDGKTDLAIFGYQTLAIWKNNGDGSFSDVTEKSGLPKTTTWAMTAAWVDADHDADLDLFVGNFADLSQFPAKDSATFPDDFAGEENRLFQNNGNGTFTDITAKAGLAGGKNKTTAVVPTDFNNQRDIDFLVVNYGSPAQLFSNQRDGSFKEIAASVGINFSGKALGVGAGDLNKDNFVDFYLPDADGNSALFLSDGKGAFARRGEGATGRKGEYAAQIADFDNDGLLDVVTQIAGGVSLQRGLGDKLADAVVIATPDSRLPTPLSRSFALGDITNDGGVDLLSFVGDGSIVTLKSEGFGKNFARIQLAGKTSNRSALGTKVELRSGSLRQKLEVYSASPAVAAAGVTFGLGDRTAVDALTMFWPAGIMQSELAIKPGDNQVDELDRKGTSCPLLYAWNGSEYSFVTDFLGGSAIGYLLAPGVYNYPDTDEYIRVTGEQLKEKDGLLSLRMNNQLEEVIFFDEAKLLAVDHPADVDIYPNERLMPARPYPSFKLFSVKAPRPPVAATDDKGNNILPLIKDVDRRSPEDFEKLRFKGYAREHAIELDLGDTAKAKQVLLLMTAWIDYADSTSNLAAAQAGEKLVPPYLQVKNTAGQWQTVIPQMGFPAGLPKTMTVDLTGKFLCADSRVRIVTSMRIYWDQILVDASEGNAPVKVTTLDPMVASLRWRGFPREYSPDGRKPLIYDYRTIEPFAPWKAHLGNYTRFGDVRELLTAADDMYVVTRNGDEIQLDFDARRLPALPSGWKRTYLVFADGFGKDMDVNSARPETVGELPFHKMKSYPYSPGDAYPNDKRHQDYLERYNTRTVGNQTQAAWRGVK
ncbi:MAG: FG-GAP-like repeat-containing protein [Acidobacteriota bacterium]|nr:FG-GAP-like repeat-containing protein [Acidobacteriota bacterium]